MNRVYPQAIELVRQGRVDVLGVVSDRFDLGDAPAAFALAGRREGRKTVVTAA
jgi:threonine dehydrogenase-like Zn-dependent dehydrogenase